MEEKTFFVAKRRQHIIGGMFLGGVMRFRARSNTAPRGSLRPDSLRCFTFSFDIPGQQNGLVIVRNHPSYQEEADMKESVFCFPPQRARPAQPPRNQRARP